MAPISKKTINIPNATWLKNVAKSFGMASLDIMGATMPVTKEMAVSTKDAISGLKDTFRDLKNGRNKNNAALNAINIGKDAIKHSLEDLKSGKLYNTERDSGFGDFGDFDDFSFDDDFSFGDDNFEVESDNEDTNINVKVFQEPMGPNNPLVKAMEMNAEISVSTTEAIIENERTTSMAKMAVSSKGFTEMVSGINTVNQNLAKIIEFNNSSMTSFITTSIKYYEDNMRLMERLAERMAPIKSSSTNRESSYNDRIFNYEGAINMEEYFKNIQGNFKDYLDSSAIGMILPFLEGGDEGGMKLTFNPLQEAVTFAVKGLVGKNLIDSFNKFDKSLGSFVPALFNKVSGLSNSSNGILSAIGEIFGIKSKGQQRENLKDYEKGRVDFDGLAHKSITMVIPTYLRKILSALTGGPEVGYDYNSGTFKNISTAKAERDKQIDHAVLRNQYDILDEIKKTIAESPGVIREDVEMESFSKNIEKFFIELAKTQKVPNLNIRSDSLGEIDDLADIFDFSDTDELESFRKILKTIKQVNPKILADSFGLGNLRAREDLFNLTKSGGNNLLNNVDMLYAWGESVGVKGAGTKSRTTPSIKYTGERQLPTDEQEIFDRLVSEYPAYDEAKILKMTKEEARRKKNKNWFDEIADKIYNKFPEPVRKMVEGPAKFISEKLDKVTSIMYNLLFGGDADEKRSLFDIMTDSFTKMWENSKKFIEEKILEPLTESLFGDDGIFTKISNSSKMKDFGKFIFGSKDGDGNFTGGLFSGVATELGNIGKRFKHYFDGKPVEGLGLEDNQKESILGNLKDNFNKFKETMSEYLFGKKELDEKGKNKNSFFSVLGQGFQNFSEALFGPKILKTKDGEFENKNYVNINDLISKMKEKMPKAIANGIVGAGIGGMAISGMGLMGTLVGGPVGGVILGMGAGMLTQSDKFMRFMFGGEDEEGNKIKGLIGKKVVDFFKENKTALIGGAVLGTVKSMLFSSGTSMLGSLFGGPLVGAALGASTALITKSESFKKLLFGGEDKNGNKIKGLLTGVTNKFAKANNLKGNVFAGLLGGGGLGLVLSNLGILGGFGLMGPLGGALMGGAAGIALSFDKWKDLVFGKVDEESGLRRGGWVEKLGNFAKEEVLTPFSNLLLRTGNRILDTFERSIKIPIMTALDPIVQGFKALTDGATRFFKNIVERTTSVIGKAVSKILWASTAPLRWIGKGLARGLESALYKIAALPINLVGGGISLAGRIGAGLADSEKYKATKQGFRDRRKAAISGKGEFEGSSAWDRIAGFAGSTFDIWGTQRWDDEFHENVDGFYENRKGMIGDWKERSKARKEAQKKKEEEDAKRRKKVRKAGYVTSDEDFAKRAARAKGKSVQEAMVENTLAVEKSGEAMVSTLIDVKDFAGNTYEKFKSIISEDRIRVVLTNKKDDINDDSISDTGELPINTIGGVSPDGKSMADKIYDNLKSENSSEAIQKLQAEEEKNEKQEAFYEKFIAVEKEGQEEQKKHNKLWEAIFSKGGLITGGLLLAIPHIIKFFSSDFGQNILSAIVGGITSIGSSIVGGLGTIISNNFKWLLDFLGFDTEDNDSNDNGVKDGNENLAGEDVMAGERAYDVARYGTQISKMAMNNFDDYATKLANFGKQTVAETGEKVVKEGTETIVSEVVENTTTKAAGMVDDIATSKQTQTAMETMIKWFDDIFKGLKAAFSKFGKSLSDRVKTAFDDAIKAVWALPKEKFVKTTNIIGEGSKNLTSKGVSALKKASNIFIVHGFLTGWSDNDTAMLFDVLPADLDITMRMISSAYKGFVNTTLGFKVELIGIAVNAVGSFMLDPMNAILKLFGFSPMVDFDVFKWLAGILYNVLVSLVPGGSTVETLNLAQDEFTKNYQAYVDASMEVTGVAPSRDTYAKLVSDASNGISAWDKFTGWVGDSYRGLSGVVADTESNTKLAGYIADIISTEKVLASGSLNDYNRMAFETHLKQTVDKANALLVRDDRNRDTFIVKRDGQIEDVNELLKGMGITDSSRLLNASSYPKGIKTNHAYTSEGLKDEESGSGYSSTPSVQSHMSSSATNILSNAELQSLYGGHSFGGMYNSGEEEVSEGNALSNRTSGGNSHITNWFKKTFDAQVPGTYVSSEYNIARPSLGDVHSGLDFTNPNGFMNLDVRSPVNGYVADPFAYDTGFGNNVVIKDDTGLSHIFAHLDRVTTEPGKRISANTIIGETGTTGRSTGPHLHYEVRGNRSLPSTHMNPHELNLNSINKGESGYVGWNGDYSNSNIIYPQQLNNMAGLPSTGEIRESDNTKSFSSIWDYLTDFMSEAGNIVWKALGFSTKDEAESSLNSSFDSNTNNLMYGPSATPTFNLSGIPQPGNDEYELQSDGSYLHKPSGYITYIGPDGTMREIHQNSYPLTDYLGTKQSNTFNPAYRDMYHMPLTGYQVNRTRDKGYLENIVNYYSSKYGSSPFYKNHLDSVLDVAEGYNVDPRYIMSHAITESGWDPYSDVDSIAAKKNNLFGITAYDGDVFNSATTFGNNGDVYSGLAGGMDWIYRNFLNKPTKDGPSQNTLYEMMFGVKNHQYAGYTQQGTEAVFPNMDWMTNIGQIMSHGVGGQAPGMDMGEAEINENLDTLGKNIDRIFSKTTMDMSSGLKNVGGPTQTQTIDNDLLREMVTELRKINNNTELSALETEKLNSKNWELSVNGGTSITGGDTSVSKTEVGPRQIVIDKEKAKQSDGEYKRNRKIAQGRLV